MREKLMRARWALAAAVLAAVLGLAGCAAGEAYPAATARQLQSGVQEVAATVATRDYAGAIAKLDALQTRADAAQKEGDLDHARYLAVSRSIAAVRADLVDLQAAAERAQLEQQLQQLQQKQQKQGEEDKGHGKHDG
jgi:uncharacterized membrane protein YdfJ with MMPL/SSD domain